MGSSNSKSESRLSREEEHRKQALAEYGVLLPPSFAVGLALPATPSVVDRFPIIPSYLDYLREMDTSRRVLKDFLQPGIWVSTQAASNTQVRASINLNEPLDWKTGQGRLFCQQQRGGWITQLRAGTSSRLPTMSAVYEMTPNCSIFGHSNTQGAGWVGGYLDFTLKDPTTTNIVPQKDHSTTNRTAPPINIKAGAWVPVDWTKITSRTGKEASKKQASSLLSKLHGYTALGFLGTTAAVEASLDTSSYEFDTRSYLSIDLADDKHPPLQLSLERTNDGRSSIALCQVLTFDRYQLNPMEDRAPHIRNSFAWTVRMEQSENQPLNNTKAVSETSSTHPALIQVGVAWQINRAVAVKALVEPQTAQLTTGVVFKRWRQPRITCSLIHKHDWHKAKGQFLGFGIELETGGSENAYETYVYPNGPVYSTASNGRGDDNVPETKAILG